MDLRKILFLYFTTIIGNNQIDVGLEFDHKHTIMSMVLKYADKSYAWLECSPDDLGVHNLSSIKSWFTCAIALGIYLQSILT